MTADLAARCRAILDGRGDSSDLTHDELRAALWMFVDVDDPETRAETGAHLLARAAERLAEAAPGSAWVLTPAGAGPVGARSFPVVSIARAEDAARLYAFVVCHPGAPVSDAWHRVGCPSPFCTLLNGHAGAHLGRSGATWTEVPVGDTPYDALDRAQLAVARWTLENATELLTLLEGDDAVCGEDDRAEMAAELREVLAAWRKASEDVRAFVHGLRGGDE